MDLQMCEQSELLNSTTSTNEKKISLDPEVSEKPIRRKYTIEYKLRILQEADKCPPGEMGALLRREGWKHKTLHKKKDCFVFSFSVGFWSRSSRKLFIRLILTSLLG